MTEQKTFNILQLEKACYAGDYTSALQQWLIFCDLLVVVNVNNSRKNFYHSAQDYESVLARLASVLTALFCNPKLYLNEDNIEKLLFYKKYLTIPFYATSLKSTRHILENIAQSDQQSNIYFENGLAHLNYLLTCSCESAPINIVQILSKLPEIIRLNVWCSLLSEEFMPTQKAAMTKKRLLEITPKLCQNFTNYELVNVNLLQNLRNVFMVCSYLTESDKHDCKYYLGQFFRRWILTKSVHEPVLPAKRQLKKKPVLLVMNEHFKQCHAMFRCFATLIKTLKSRFSLILLSMEDEYDPSAELIFDEIIDFPEQWQTEMPEKIIKIITDCQPDIIYYPSIGMKLWTVIFCQLRLAPIQVMSNGHPATSMSPMIDYVLSREGNINDANCYSETVVAIKDEDFKFSHLPRRLSENADFRLNKEKIDEKTQYTGVNERFDQQESRKSSPQLLTHAIPEKNIKIAVPAIVFKLNHEFIDTCRLIFQRSQQAIEFVFFPSRGNIHCTAIKYFLQQYFPCKVLPYMSYTDYMSELNQCNLQLSSFPFGNTNGFVDGISLGLPIVCLHGAEIHSMIDVALSQTAGLPNFCRANNRDEYIDAVIRLIHQQDERLAISKTLLDDQIIERFFVAENQDEPKDFLRSFCWLYHHHEQIQQQARKCWWVKDRVMVRSEHEITSLS